MSLSAFCPSSLHQIRPWRWAEGERSLKSHSWDPPTLSHGSVVSRECLSPIGLLGWCPRGDRFPVVVAQSTPTPDS